MKTKLINLQATGVPDLQSWNRFTLDMAELGQLQKGAMYQIRIGFRQEHALYYCGEASTDLQPPLPEENWDQAEEESYWDSYYYTEDYDWQQRDNPCHSSYYGRRRSVIKTLFVSELGLIAKRGDEGDIYLFATNLLSTEPESGVSMKLYDYQQQLITEASTNGQGMVRVRPERKPFVLVAQKGEQWGYLKLGDGNALSMSHFNTAGQTVQKGVKGFIYGERGVWRPGDTLYVSFMLEDKAGTLPLGHPVILELSNPQGQLHSRLVRSQSMGGIYQFNLATPESAPTGNWLARVKVGGTEFTKVLKIETVKPNRLRVQLDFGRERLTQEQGSLTATLRSQWLHGASAKNLKATVDALLVPMETRFENTLTTDLMMLQKPFSLKRKRF
ncbi:MAG: hypothetical protein HC842_06180 [Cytophagales bacterium]|nr:hypothetical protein [Cytophagales bacterium]